MNTHHPIGIFQIRDISVVYAESRCIRVVSAPLRLTRGTWRKAAWCSLSIRRTSHILLHLRDGSTRIDKRPRRPHYGWLPSRQILRNLELPIELRDRLPPVRT